MRTIKEIEHSAERSWARGQLDERERGRMAELRRTPSPNDARLLRPTRCRVLKPFCVQGKPVAVGATVTLAWHDAQSLEHLGKVTIL